MKLWDVECREDASARFEDLLTEEYAWLNEVLKEEGFLRPSPIQVEAIRHGLKGSSLIAQSKAGTGKTISFLTLVLAKVKPGFGLQAMVVSPTRELSNQIFNVAFGLNRRLPKAKRLNILLLIGGLPIKDDISKIKGRPDVIIGTVGRVALHFKDANLSLQSLRLMVCDEADILIKGKDFRRLFGLVRHEKEKRPLQICCYSATFNRENFKKYCRYLYPCLRINNECLIRNEYRKQPVEPAERPAYQLPPGERPPPAVQQSLNVSQMDQFVVELDSQTDKSLSLLKMEWVVRILKAVEYQQCMIFYNDKGRGDQIIAELKEHEIYEQAAYFHGDLIQAHRIKLMNRIRLKHIKIILATDVLSRGIDLQKVDLVVNFDDPHDTDNYFHRIGRTARFGKYGVSFLLMQEAKLATFLANKHYAFNITRLAGEPAFREAAAAANAKLRSQADQPARDETAVNMSNVSLVSEWVDCGVQLYDHNSFKYADPALLLPDGPAQDSGQDGESGSSEEAADQDSQEAEPEPVLDEAGPAQPPKPADGSDARIGKRVVAEEQVSFETFSKLFDLMADPALCSIARDTFHMCEADLLFVDMLDCFDKI